MRYYLMCKKILGQKKFDEFVASLTSEIDKKFSGDILLDEYLEILEYNIKISVLIALCEVLGLSDEEKNEKIHLEGAKHYLIANGINEFNEKNIEYIKLMVESLNQQ